MIKCNAHSPIIQYYSLDNVIDERYTFINNLDQEILTLIIFYSYMMYHTY